MAAEDVEMVRESLLHWARTGEVDWDLAHEDLEIRDHDILDAGEYRGRSGFERWMTDWAAAWSRFSMEPQEFLDAGEDAVVAFVRIRAVGAGSSIPVERDDAIVYRLRDGLVARIDYYNNREQALQAVAAG
jgi:ketosteroid isomerase-like protein